MALMTDLAIRNWKPTKPRETKPCGGRDGLYIRANSAGGKVFYWRKTSFYRLGDYPELTLTKARAMVAVCNDRAQAGIAPETIVAVVRGATSVSDVAEANQETIEALPKSRFPTNASKKLMEAEGLGDPGLIHQTPTPDLARVFGTDAVMYVEVLDWKSNYQIVSSSIDVEFLYTL